MKDRKNFCQACSNKKFGVKTRKHVWHTCGIDDDKTKEPRDKKYDVKY